MNNNTFTIKYRTKRGTNKEVEVKDLWIENLFLMKDGMGNIIIRKDNKQIALITREGDIVLK